MASDQDDLVRTDPASEGCFSRLVDVIAAEMGARVAFGDDPSTAEGCLALAELVADAVLDHFAVRETTAPRYRWLDGGATNPAPGDESDD